MTLSGGQKAPPNFTLGICPCTIHLPLLPPRLQMREEGCKVNLSLDLCFQMSFPPNKVGAPSRNSCGMWEWMGDAIPGNSGLCLRTIPAQQRVQASSTTQGIGIFLGKCHFHATHPNQGSPSPAPLAPGSPVMPLSWSRGSRAGPACSFPRKTSLERVTEVILTLCLSQHHQVLV